MDVNSKIEDIDNVELNHGVYQLIVQSIKDLDQSIDNEKLTWLKNRIIELISLKCKHWVWGEIVKTFEMGLAGDFGASSKLTVQAFNNWLREMNNRKSQKNRENINRFHPSIFNMKEKKTGLPFGSAMCYLIDRKYKFGENFPDNIEKLEDIAKKIQSGEINYKKSEHIRNY